MKYLLGCPFFREFSTFAALLLTTPGLFAIQVGGGSEVIQHWAGGIPAVYLGDSVSNAGDVDADGIEDVVVFAHEGTGGAVRVFSGIDGAEIYYITPILSVDVMGPAVSGAGDVNADGFDDILIGTYNAAPAGLSQAGWVTVYSGIDGSILNRWEGAAAGDSFGWSVSKAGDLDLDGFADILVGAPHTTVGGNGNAGSIFAFSGATGAQIHRWDGLHSTSYLGGHLSSAGDTNGDGIPDVIAGTGRNEAFVFSGLDGAVLHTFSGNQQVQGLGSSVSSAGDIDQDGFADVIVGAGRSSSSGSPDVGSAHVYSGATGAEIYHWIGQASHDLFGYSVSSTNDANGDMIPDLIIGATQNLLWWTVGPGYVDLYSGADGALLQRWHGDSQADDFGRSVSGLGDLDGDGLTEIVVSAPAADSGGALSSGDVWVFGFKPFLQVTPDAVSALSGGTLDITLDFPETSSGYRYRVLMSASGTGPLVAGIPIPLSLDSLLVQTARGIYPFVTHSNLGGVLDAAGDANGSITVAAGTASRLIGRTLWFAAIDALPGQLPAHSSIAVPFEILP